jgi:hypothetical protein
MKRIAVIFMVAAAVTFAISGFKTVDRKAVNIGDSLLHSDEANFRLMPGNHYKPDSVNLSVRISDGIGSMIVGARKIELLKIPVEGVAFRIPLSKSLESRKKYRVSVEVQSDTNDCTSLVWENITVVGTRSAGFFEKNFKPISEPADLRNQMQVSGIRKIIR